MRHIPSAPSLSAPVLTFREALRPTADDFDRSRWIYIPDRYSEYRYVLGTCGLKPLICAGINPSTAAPGRLDNTLKSVERIALHNGYDSFLMFNVYAQRATLPDDMDRELNPFLHAENMKAFAWLMEKSGPEPVIWAAWGAVIEKRRYLPGCVLDMASIASRFGARWVTAGPRSKAGHPHHPLYLKKDTPLDPFTDLDSYLFSLQKALCRKDPDHDAENIRRNLYTEDP